MAEVLSRLVANHRKKRGIIARKRSCKGLNMHIIKRCTGCICKTGQRFYNDDILRNGVRSNTFAEYFAQPLLMVVILGFAADGVMVPAV